ncbi:MAG: hypothetical protein EXR74_01190 [Bdellovibrionales bacterium]|nr:hypothetical protein [Bdellovibrionales bacterium]
MKRSLRYFRSSVLVNKKETHPVWSFVLRNGRTSLKILLLGTATFLLSTGSAYGGVSSSVSRFALSRSPSSLIFPQVETERDSSDILASYPAYLKFVVEVGKDVDHSSTARLVKIFESLKRRSPKGAALFLKGLRFELVQKVELMGTDSREISTSNPIYRRWIQKYLKEWVREADEHLFRSYSESKNELALAE